MSDVAGGNLETGRRSAGGGVGLCAAEAGLGFGWRVWARLIWVAEMNAGGLLAWRENQLRWMEMRRNERDSKSKRARTEDMTRVLK